MTLDGRKDGRGSAAAMSTGVMSVIVAVLAGRLLFSDERMVRLAGVIVLIVAGSLFLFSCLGLFRSKT
jgi:glucose uptake protein GlcU